MPRFRFEYLLYRIPKPTPRIAIVANPFMELVLASTNETVYTKQQSLFLDMLISQSI